MYNYMLITLLGLSRAYDVDQVSRCLWLSGSAYCEKNTYDTMQVGGPATGFVLNTTLYDPETDIQGYTGVMHEHNSIYVVLRGSSSLTNWLDDFEVTMTEYTSFPECDCQVHKGFYRSALAIRDVTTRSVENMLISYPSFQVIVTGHSYGASVGQLLAMELKNAGINNAVYNFGQPRIGDSNYARFANMVLDEYWRVTHDRDIVPHLPPIKGFGYMHSCGELFEDLGGELHICSENACEDPNCADQYNIFQTNANDHTYYLGHHLACDDSIL